MKTIVAATDFSVVSLNAVDYAADMAMATGSNLSIVHVCAIPLSFSEVAVAADNIQEVVTIAEEHMSELKEKMVSRTAGKVRINTHVIQGDVLAGIEEFSASVNPHAIVMGSESTSAFERFLVGGKTLSAIRYFSSPLLVVPPGAHFGSIRKIGLACDFREVIDTMPAKAIRDMVSQFGAELHILYVSHEHGTSFSPETIEESGWLQDMLGDLQPRYDFIEGDDIEAGINAFAVNNNLDLLIIVPKKHNLISKLFVQSHSKKLVLHAHVPVMAIHE